MATVYSKADLWNRALRELGVLDHGEEAEGEMAVLVTDTLQQMLEYLNDENLLIFDPSVSAATQVIPGRIMGGMCDALKWQLAPAYSRPREVATFDLALVRLRRSVAPAEAPIPTQFESF